MNPSPQLVLLTVQKINTYLKSMNQSESYISEAWVFEALKTHIQQSIETGLILSDSEISDRVTTIAVRRIHANIITAERFMKDEQNFYRPYEEKIQDLSSNTFAMIPPRGEMAHRRPKFEGEIPDRFIDLSDGA
tara:strand:- start:1467 stop:1868 length:402 start_codon:yes stop_codon:yes gene_type:complete